MKLNQTKPHEVSKDPEKDAAELRAKRKLFGESILFLIIMGLSIWWNKSPETLRATFYYIVELLK